MLAAKHAAIIGIDAYGSGIAPLQSAVADSRARHEWIDIKR